MTEQERLQHRTVIIDFLTFLNQQSTSFVLKGGTSLMLAYGLDRLSEDIDLDGMPEQDIVPLVEKFCANKGYSCNLNKKTPSVQREMIHYSDSVRPLKVEVSYRGGNIASDSFDIYNGIQVYKLSRITSMKINAYTQRDKLRDLYDLTFIGLNHIDSLPNETIAQLKDALAFRGLEHFDYLTQTQTDELIDVKKLTEDFLTLWDKLGLLEYDYENENVVHEDDIDP